MGDWDRELRKRCDHCEGRGCIVCDKGALERQRAKEQKEEALLFLQANIVQQDWSGNPTVRIPLDLNSLTNLTIAAIAHGRSEALKAMAPANGERGGLFADRFDLLEWDDQSPTLV